MHSTSRILSLDATKAFAIFCVILGHVIQWTFPGNEYEENWAFQFIYSFHMPLFMVVSGYFAGRSLSRSFVSFLWHKATQLLLPVISFSVLFLCFCYAFYGVPDNIVSDVIAYLAGGDLWFLKYLFVDLVVLYVSKRLLHNDLAALLPTLLLFVLTRATLWRLLPYLWLGYFLAKYRNRVSRNLHILLSVSGIAFALLLTLWHGSYDAPLRFLYLRPTIHFDYANTWAVCIRICIGLAGSTFWILLFQSLEGALQFWRGSRFFCSMGEHTLGIYALQLYILEYGMTHCLSWQFIGWIALPTQLLIAIVVTLLCDVLVRLLQSNQITALLFLGQSPRNGDKTFRAPRSILLSFDIEEFDVPREHGVDYDPVAEGMTVSRLGTERILEVLRANDVRATFFCTGNFAENAPDLIGHIKAERHEVACHGVDHWHPQASDVVRSKEIVERVAGVTVHGYRQPRMFPVSDEAIRAAGYSYNSSLNPAFIPGRYMHLTTPRTWFMKDGVMQIPASVTPWLRFPLFWLSLHNLPESLYHWLVRRTLKHDGYFVTYFHPWEFYELSEHPELRMPFIIRNHSGQQMCKRLDSLIKMLKDRGHDFVTFQEFVSHPSRR